MTKTSGYELPITVWVSCHPNDPDSMRHADALIEHVKDMLQTPDILDVATVLIERRKWYTRRKLPAPVQPALAEPLAQDQAAPDAAAPASASGAGEDMPEIPENLRRVPR